MSLTSYRAAPPRVMKPSPQPAKAGGYRPSPHPCPPLRLPAETLGIWPKSGRWLPGRGDVLTAVNPRLVISHGVRRVGSETVSPNRGSRRVVAVGGGCAGRRFW